VPVSQELSARLGGRTSGCVPGLQRGLFGGDNRSRTEPRSDPSG
jgi:hypothetical protein